MKKLMLGIALAGSACGQQPQTIEAGPPPTPVTAPLHPLIGSEDNPTTTVPATTTTAAPVTTRATRTPRATTTTELPSPQSRTVGRGTEPAGGDVWAIPTYIVMCESGGSWTAENLSGAAGPYQLMPEHFGGESALNQSREAQHAKAAELWNGGKGRSHWEACL